jgi:hypothetical protein
VEAKISEDRDDPNTPSKRSVEVVEGVDWDQNNETKHQPGPESFRGVKVWARRVRPTPRAGRGRELLSENDGAS